jgi:hypothetical protein
MREDKASSCLWQKPRTRFRKKRLESIDYWLSIVRNALNEGDVKSAARAFRIAKDVAEDRIDPKSRKAIKRRRRKTFAMAVQLAEHMAALEDE